MRQRSDPGYAVRDGANVFRAGVFVSHVKGAMIGCKHVEHPAPCPLDQSLTHRGIPERGGTQPAVTVLPLQHGGIQEEIVWRRFACHPLSGACFGNQICPGRCRHVDDMECCMLAGGRRKNCPDSCSFRLRRSRCGMHCRVPPVTDRFRRRLQHGVVFAVDQEVYVRSCQPAEDRFHLLVAQHRYPHPGTLNTV